jgi:hypothetical protein
LRGRRMLKAGQRRLTKVFSLGSVQFERVGDETHGARSRLGDPACLDVANMPDTDAGFVGQLVLRDGQAPSMFTYQLPKHLAFPLHESHRQTGSAGPFPKG